MQLQLQSQLLGRAKLPVDQVLSQGPNMLNKLSTFGEGKTIETDVKGWRDYQWQLQQYLVAMNDGYDSEFHQFTRNPNAALDMRRRTATEATSCIPCLPV